jgi:hypothetical protein
MRSKRASIFLILLANIVFLAHALVPHHHHESQVCLESCSCHSDCSTHKHNTTAHNHNHDGSDCSENCVLKQTVVIPSNQFRQELKYAAGENHHSPYHNFHAVIINCEQLSFVPKIISIAQIPLIISSHSGFTPGSTGLRAPPAV